MVSMLDGDELDAVAAAGIAARHRNTRRPLSHLARPPRARGPRDAADQRHRARPAHQPAMRERTGDRSHICVPLFRGAAPSPRSASWRRTAARRSTRTPAARSSCSRSMLSSASATRRRSRRSARRSTRSARFEAIFAGAVIGHRGARRRRHDPGAQPGLPRAARLGAELVGGRRLSVLPAAEDQPVARGLLAEVMRGERDAVRLEHRLVRGDGRSVWVSASISVVRAARRAAADFAIADGPGHHAGAGAPRQALAAQAEVNRHQALHDALTGPRQPHAVPATASSRRSHAAQREGGGRGAADRPRPLQGGQRLARPPRRRRAADRARPAPAQAVLRARTPSRASAATSSACCCPTPPAPRTSLRSSSASRPRSSSRSTVDGPAASVEASIGDRALPATTAPTPRRCSQRADVAMYHAKAGTPGYAFYEREPRRRSDPRAARRSSASCAARSSSDELALHYQPKARADATARCARVEALLRWHHPERGLLCRRRVHPARRAHRADRPLTLLRDRRGAPPDAAPGSTTACELAVAVNLVPRNLLDPSFPAQVAALLDRGGVEPALLELEITESADDRRPRRAPSRPRAALGDGHPALDRRLRHRLLLARLPHRLPVDEIKIDRSFVTGMAADERRRRDRALDDRPRPQPRARRRGRGRRDQAHAGTG